MDGLVERVTPIVASKPVGGSETVLLVEDDEPTRNITVLLLQHLGYRVLEAAGGEEAMRVAEASEEKIHLLMTDVVMPGMSGRELADALRSRTPILKVLFQSGYTDATVMRRGMLQSHNSIPAKALYVKLFGQQGSRNIRSPFRVCAPSQCVTSMADGETLDAAMQLLRCSNINRLSPAAQEAPHRSRRPPS